MNPEHQTIASSLQNSLLQEFDQSMMRGAGTIHFFSKNGAKAATGPSGIQD
jgi:hypothetical protein